MKNIQTFNEFVNESNKSINEGIAKKVGEFVMDNEPDSDTLTNIKAIAKDLKINIDDLKQIDSEMHYKTPEYSAVEGAFSKGSSKSIDLPNGSSMSGPFVYVNKQTGIAKYEEQGFTAYMFSDKSKF